MKLSYLLLLTLFLGGCIKTPEAPASKELIANTTIQENKNEAEEAQEAYKRLQKQRCVE